MMQSINNEAEESFVLLSKDENIAFDTEKNIILLTFDDNYVNQTINLMFSISKFHKGEVSYICMCPRLEQANIELLLSQREGIQIRCYDYLGGFKVKKWPICSIFRLFAPWLLEDDISKVLYLDSDIICKGSIVQLLNWETEYIAMCPEIDGSAVHFSAGIPTVQIYCNSGVCVLNLAAIRENYSFRELYASFHEMSDRLAFPDQDFLNRYFRSKLELINGYLYNFIPYELKGSTRYINVLHNCKLIHFAGIKPWSYKCELYQIHLYLKYTEYKPMRIICKHALWRSHFHAIVRLNRPIQRWYHGAFVPWRKGRGK